MAPPSPSYTYSHPPGWSARRTGLASRLVPISAVLFVLSTIAFVGNFDPGASRLLFGTRTPDFGGIDGSYGTLRGEDVREPEWDHDGNGGSCPDVLLFLPGAGNAGGGGAPPDLAFQLRAYVVAALAATYTNMALVLLEDPTDSTTLGCPVDTVEEHGNSFHFERHYEKPRGLSTVVRHPAWLSRGCGPPCPGKYGYDDWLGLSRSATGGGEGGADIPGAASVLCEESTSNILVVTSESVFVYFHHLLPEMVDRRTWSIRKAHGWAVNLGATEDEVTVLATLQGGDDILDYAEALLARTGIPMLQPWISRDVQSFAETNKMENWMSGGDRRSVAVYKPEDHIPFEEYLHKLSDNCQTHQVYVATKYPIAVQDAIQALPTRRKGRYTIESKKRCVAFKFKVGLDFIINNWSVHRPNCRQRYDETVATVAELMVLAQASILVGDLSTNSGRLARFIRSTPAVSTAVINGKGRPTTSRSTVVLGDESKSRHVYYLPVSAAAFYHDPAIIDVNRADQTNEGTKPPGRCLISSRGSDGIGHQLEAKLSCIATAAALAEFGVQYVHFPLASADHGLEPHELAAVEDAFALNRFGSLDPATLHVAKREPLPNVGWCQGTSWFDDIESKACRQEPKTVYLADNCWDFFYCNILPKAKYQEGIVDALQNLAIEGHSWRGDDSRLVIVVHIRQTDGRKYPISFFESVVLGLKSVEPDARIIVHSDEEIEQSTFPAGVEFMDNEESTGITDVLKDFIRADVLVASLSSLSYAAGLSRVGRPVISGIDPSRLGLMSLPGWYMVEAGSKHETDLNFYRAIVTEALAWKQKASAGKTERRHGEKVRH